MRRELPTDPHLDHLKKQAKSLLDAHKRGDPEATPRIRAALPSFAALSDAEILRAPFALHDAQSAIAREYGFKSWNDLRAEVTKRRAHVFPEALVRSLMDTPFIRGLMGASLPEAAYAAMKDAWPRDSAEAVSAGVPATLPLLAVRNAMVIPGAIVPLHVGRAASLAAIDAALKETPPLLATFAQRNVESEDVGVDSLHPIGCQVIVHRRVLDPEGRAFVILGGLRWIALEGIDPAASPAGHVLARIATFDVDDGDEAGEVPALVQSLRDVAKRLAGALPEPARAIELIDAIDDAERLANLVVANLACAVDDKARYAAEARLAEKLRIATKLAEAALVV